MQERAKILFVCTANSCRSQMAEGWCRALKGASMDCYSAGVEPSELNPIAVRVMAEAGIDISSQYSKHIDSLKHLHFDLAITVCDQAKGACPVIRNASTIMHRSFSDPVALAKQEPNEQRALDLYRLTRDQIRDFILALPDELTRGPQAS